jgi:hypothetical protein
VLFFGDDHGGEAVVGRRDAYWASGGFAVTNILLLSAIWVVGAVFADRNALALGGILNQQGVGNSTVSQSPWCKNTKSCVLAICIFFAAPER